MKSFYSAVFFACLFMASFAASAQARSPRSTAHSPKPGRTANVSHQQQILQSLLQRQLAQREEYMHAGAARTSSTTGERLKSFCGYNFGDTAYFATGKSDSAYYFYTGTNSSRFNFQLMDYQSPSLATYTAPVDLDYPLDLNYVPGAGQLLHNELLPDSIYTFNSFCPVGVVFPDTFGFADISSYVYSADFTAQGSDRFYPLVPGQLTRYKTFFNGTGLPELTLFLSYNNGTATWDTTNMEVFTYNGLNQLVADSSSVNSGAGIWSEDSKNSYGYDGMGNVMYNIFYADSSGHWQPQTAQYLTYNTDGSLQKDSVAQYNAGIWTAYKTDSFGYNAGISYFTFDETELYVSDSVYSRCTYTKHVSGSGLPDTLFYRFYGGGGLPVNSLVSGKKTVYTYDSHDNPVVATSFSYHITDPVTGAGDYVGSPERAFYYHYEDFDVTGVSSEVLAADPLVMHPNPATDQVVISSPQKVVNGLAMLQIADMSGRVVSEENIYWVNNSVHFSLAALLPGAYIVSLTDSNGRRITRQKLIKF